MKKRLPQKPREYVLKKRLRLRKSVWLLRPRKLVLQKKQRLLPKLKKSD